MPTITEFEENSYLYAANSVFVEEMLGRFIQWDSVIVHRYAALKPFLRQEQAGSRMRIA